ncbi:amylo-alpha-1,6-glucosidase [Microvirga pudoricolor]|uniref:amylo-alpha-1,6-glucosidase n=1 Tax=Microvirga pudoricolor TaxID=2778729 RepID=UPI00194EC409|nr:amylo-alpha-1,6-glucosidase [Microvirga pudoricolor]MBM6595161.1 glycogen debranching enzyme family protein [Microvirga pudoricolor]
MGNDAAAPVAMPSAAPDRPVRPPGPCRPDEIRLGRAICGHFGQAERREWWLANGLGGYAGGTVAGSLTRRYHGLLIAPVEPPLGRRLILAKADATLVGGDVPVPLFTNGWMGGAIAPPGHVRIESFRFDYTVPVWIYEAEGRRIEHRIWMEPGANTTYAAWRLLPDACAPNAALALRVALLVNDRDHHGNMVPGGFTPDIAAEGDTLTIRDGSLFTLTIAAPGGSVTAANEWYRNFDLSLEADRGLDPVDANLFAGSADLPLGRGALMGIVASLEPDASTDLEAALERRLAHDRSVLAAAARTLPDRPDWIARLALAADAFVFARPLRDMPDGQSVIAGYPWFGDWGRDTMISLPGLTLAMGRPDTAKRILRTFARFVSQGMLPNVFPGDGAEPAYNTADASLWFFEAWRAYVDETGDTDALREVYPVLEDMIAWYLKGTRYGIGVDPADGLLRAGVSGVQVTWMDAKVGSWVVTPRIGKAVEINALWFNALRIMADFAARLGQPDTFSEPAERARAGFSRFVRPDGQGLYDVIDSPEGQDTNIRPNQIFAVSLAHSPLERDAQERVVACCTRHLLTSYGLRSLAPGSAGYCPVYGGNVRERDGGYHQGPVWTWLLGPFALAHYRVTGDAGAALAFLDPLRDALADGGLGTLGEIFDGDPPHHPRGAPAQAWSVACTLDAWRRLQGELSSNQGRT